MTHNRRDILNLSTCTDDARFLPMLLVFSRIPTLLNTIVVTLLCVISMYISLILQTRVNPAMADCSRDEIFYTCKNFRHDKTIAFAILVKIVCILVD